MSGKPWQEGGVLSYEELLAALTAFKKGDFSVRLPLDKTGLAGKVADTLNEIFDRSEATLREIRRLNKVVGKEGQIQQRAVIGTNGGDWTSYLECVNELIGDLAQPSADAARVIRSVAQGDLSQRMSLDIDGTGLRGEFLTIAKSVNAMVDQLNCFVSEVTRVTHQIGTEGELGGRAELSGAAGVWKELTDNINTTVSNVTRQVREIALVTEAVAEGDLSRTITIDARGEILALKKTINTMVSQLNGFASEVNRVAREVGTEGKLGAQAEVRGIGGVWRDLTDNVNSMAGNLTGQVRNIAAVTTSVAKGDLSQKITVDVRGEFLELKNTINTMVDQLNDFTSEVTRVAREVGTEGKLGGQAQVKGVAGVWKDLADNVNSMARNLTAQVRNIAAVTTAVANGDLSQKITVDVRGEILELKNTINVLVDQLKDFSSEVTRVAREVGTEGKLGGQAHVPGAAGIWMDLTNSLNQLAATLTAQVRAIAEVATAVTKGDLSRSIAVEAQGEVAALKDNINEMILNLGETTRKNTEQDWLKTNLARFTRMLQGQRDLLAVSKLVLSELAPLVGANVGIFYVSEWNHDDERVLRRLSGYALKQQSGAPSEFRMGEGLIGQCALEKERILIANPPKDYLTISSGLGESAAANILVLPVLFEGDVKAVIELASLGRFSDTHLAFLDQLTDSMGIVLNTIAATMRTEQLLQQSQALAQELQARQEELTQGNRQLEDQARILQSSEELLKQQKGQLRHTNAELQDQARLLSEQKAEVERKNSEVEQAKIALEEKADQLALTSKYKSEFLANMSHELRTPLNTMLILSKVLCENEEARMTAREVRMVETIHSCGSELLSLISDILDLSKIESGMMTVQLSEVPLADLREYVDRTFRHLAEAKGLLFHVEADPGVPEIIYTDAKCLQQVIRNLLSNAIKFTERGEVEFQIKLAAPSSSGVSGGAARTFEISVQDTGIGIPKEKQKLIFEAFRQADGTTSRKYGGTGLGLSICREIARLLGGEVRIESEVGLGSTFTLRLPENCPAPRKSPSTGAPLDSAANGARAGEGSRIGESSSNNGCEKAKPAAPRIDDDRGSIEAGDWVLLVIESDAQTAGVAIQTGRENGFKVIGTLRAREGLALAREVRPHAIILQLELPDLSGWSVLDRLKNDPATRDIPVHVISIKSGPAEGSRRRETTYLAGLWSSEKWPRIFAEAENLSNSPIHDLLVFDAVEGRRQEWLIAAGNRVCVTFADRCEEVLAGAETGAFDAVVLNAKIPDGTLFQLIEQLRSRNADCAIIAFAPENEAAPGLSETAIVPAPAERALEEAPGFLDSVRGGSASRNLPPERPARRPFRRQIPACRAAADAIQEPGRLF